MKLLILTPLFLVICLIGVASAQDAPPATPASQLPPPWLNKAPDMSHWVITLVSAGGSDSSADSAHKAPPQTVDVTKTGKTILVQTTGPDGRVTQVWRKDGSQLIKDPATNAWSVGPAVDQGDPFGQPDYIKTDFAGFDWISEKNFAGIQMVGANQCLVFKDRVLPLSRNDQGALQTVAAFTHTTVDFSSRMVDAEADIDLKTLLPLSLKLGNITRVFTYQAPPETPLQLPQEAQTAVAGYQKTQAPLLRNSAGLP